MLAATSSTTPSCQSLPVTKNISAAATLPAHAKPAMIDFLRADRSAAAPTMGSSSADAMVAIVTT